MKLLDWQVPASISSDQSDQTFREVGKENPRRRLATIKRFVDRLKHIQKSIGCRVVLASTDGDRSCRPTGVEVYCR